MKKENKSAWIVTAIGGVMCATAEFVPGMAEASPLWAPLAVMVFATGMYCLMYQKAKEKEKAEK